MAIREFMNIILPHNEKITNGERKQKSLKLNNLFSFILENSFIPFILLDLL